MKLGTSLAALAMVASGAAFAADAPLPLAAHRAAYEITLADTNVGKPPGSQTPISATGLIAYEFRGSSCEGFASNFRQVTELQRSEGEPISSDIRSVTFEDGKARTLKFEIEAQTAGSESPPISGSAERVEGDATTVDLLKPDKAKLSIGSNILFPTQHLEHIIDAAKTGATTLEARVYDGSDTGKKVFSTLTVIGKEALGSGEDAEAAPALAKVRRWPVSISYFDEAAHDAPPDYVLAFDLYENGVSGTLTLDYGSFALKAKLSKIEFLPVSSCPN